MVEFVCDNKEIEKVLYKLYQQVTANGGVVHEKLTIVSNNGDLQVTVAEEVPEGEEIIILPRVCLLPVDRYKLDLDGDKIVMISHDKDLSDGQVSMMKTMIELFNLSGKIEAQKKTSTYSLFYKDKDLLQRILKSRSEDGIPFLKDGEKMSEKSYYLESFLNTRTLGIKEEGKEGSAKFVMPFIEFLNHHAKATRYTPRYADVNSPDVKLRNEVSHVAVMKACPVEGSKECYVCYGPYDSMDALIQYNYADESAFFVRSVPMEIDLPGGIGVIGIRSITWDSQHKDLPDNLKDLEFYVPEITVNVVKDVVNLNFIYIPSNSRPHAMRRILALVLSHFELDLDQSQMIEILRFVEKRIINENIKHFEELSEYLKNYIPDPTVELIVKNAGCVVATQLNHIKSYKLLM